MLRSIQLKVPDRVRKHLRLDDVLPGPRGNPTATERPPFREDDRPLCHLLADPELIELEIATLQTARKVVDGLLV